MFNTLLKKVFGSRNDRLIKQYFQTVSVINALETTISALTDAELRAKTDEFRQRIKDGETLEILLRDGLLTLFNRSFRSAAVNEIKKYFDHYFYSEAKTLLPILKPSDLENSTKVGIRPQLVHWPTKKLVMDFIVLGDGDSVHVLNAISPGFTTSMAFSKYVVDILEGKAD